MNSLILWGRGHTHTYVHAYLPFKQSYFKKPGKHLVYQTFLHVQLLFIRLSLSTVICENPNSVISREFFEFTSILSDYRPACLPAIALGLWFQIFHTTKVINKTVILMKIYPLHHRLFLGPSLHQIMFFNKRLLMFRGGVNIAHEVSTHNNMQHAIHA